MKSNKLRYFLPLSVFLVFLYVAATYESDYLSQKITIYAVLLILFLTTILPDKRRTADSSDDDNDSKNGNDTDETSKKVL